MRDGCRCCSRCGHKTSVTAGTIFDRHRILLKHWFITAWYLAELENGISALELQQELGLGSYQSAWTIAHKLRSAMSLAVQDRLYDSVVVYITYVGSIQKSVSGRQTNRQSVVAVAAQTEPALFVPITGPDMLGSVFCGNRVPKTLFRVALLISTIPSRRGR
jgi:hypothetical protein